MFQLNQQPTSSTNQEINGIIDNSPIYVTSLSEPFGNTGTSAVLPNELSEKRKPSPKNVKQIVGGLDTDLVLTQRLSTDQSQKPSSIAAAQSVESEIQNRDKTGISDISGISDKIDTGSDIKTFIGDSVDIKVSAPSTVSVSDRRASSPFQNGRTEVLIENKFKTTAVVESNNNKLAVDQENR